MSYQRTANWSLLFLGLVISGGAAVLLCVRFSYPGESGLEELVEVQKKKSISGNLGGKLIPNSKLGIGR